MSNDLAQVFDDSVTQIDHLAKHVNKFVYYILVAWDMDDELIRKSGNIAELLKLRYKSWYDKVSNFFTNIDMLKFRSK